ncbi:MAG: hypothetical protein A2V66_06875 [Ignavibacteria bacterium RBG_13_36_8]|nr:MAG: hypothetical protein A2V66_06875 [Ignavibacteria bacterium RBG_13_36_8]
MLKRVCAFLFTIFTAALLLSYCSVNEDNRNNPDSSGRLISTTDCKQFRNIYSDIVYPPDVSCIEYEYDGSDTLLITHINAGFNCCPGELTADITIQNNIITIEEHELEAGCRCMCLYDIVYQITDLQPGTYIIKFIEPYIGENELLEVSIDLTSTIEDNYCITRTNYPWGPN